MWKFNSNSSPSSWCARHFLVAISLTVLLVIRTNPAVAEITNFLSTNILQDGEIETRIFYGGVYAKETTATAALEKGFRNSSGIKFRQLANAKNFVQLIYDEDDVLTDCEIIHARQQVEKFLKEFKSDLEKLVANSNITIESLDGEAIPHDWLDLDKTKRKCRKLHQNLKNLAQSSRWKRSMLIMPGTYWCGHEHSATSYSKLGPISGVDRCCRRHDHCKINIAGFSTKYDFINLSPFTLSHCSCDSRSKRDLGDFLRIPGTKWCGKGYSAAKYTHLGGFSRTDKCCRKHDLSCPFWIGAFDTKYGLFNWRVNTIMHCSCDERFRACLKMVDSSDANLVGKLFFNVVQSKCFVLKPKKKCMRTTWWGKCEKFKYEKHAILRDNLHY